MMNPMIRRYLLFQLPGWIAAVAVLGFCVVRGWVSLGMAFGLFALWILKDLAFYPLVRKAYDPRDIDVQKKLIGLEGVAIEPLNPTGYVRVRGELWKARVESKEGQGRASLESGAAIRVLDVDGMTLVVESL